MRKKVTGKKIMDRLRIIFAVLGALFFGTFAYGITKLDNYLNFVLFCTFSGLIGIILGILFTIVLYKLFPLIVNHEGKGQSPIIFTCCFLFLMAAPGIIRFFNEIKTTNEVCKKYKLVETGESGSRSRTYYILIEYDKRIERLEFSREYINKVKRYDSVYLCIKTGLLRFDYFSQPNQ